MKKKKIILAMLAAVLSFSFASCDGNKEVNNDKEIIENNSNLKDDDLTKKVYNEYLKSFSNIKYDEFLTNAYRYMANGEYTYQYLDSDISVKIDGSFSSKRIKNNDEVIKSKFINNNWIEIEKTNVDSSNISHVIYSILLNSDDSYNTKYEYTYDDNWNKKESKTSKFIDNEWMKIEEGIYINNSYHTTFFLSLINDSFDSKREYTYDEEGNVLTDISSKYENGNWVLKTMQEFSYDDEGYKIRDKFSKNINDKWVKLYENIYINNESKPLYKAYFNTSGFTEAYEYAYDDAGNKLESKYYKYINNDWLLMEEYIYINGNKKTLYSLNLDKNNNYDYKNEYTYDDSGNELGAKYYKYINDAWLLLEEDINIDGNKKDIYKLNLDNDNSFNYKEETKYDDKIETVIKSYYENNEWVIKEKFIQLYENNNLISVTCYEYLNNEWVLKDKAESKYNLENKLTEDILSKYEDNHWVYKTKIEYIYENESITIKYYEYLNNEWILKTSTKRKF